MNLPNPNRFSAEQKRRAAEFLFDEIGNVEDRFIAEAAAPYGRARPSFGWKRALILAATLTLIFSLLLCTLIGASLHLIFNRKDSDAAEDPVKDGYRDPMEDDYVNEENALPSTSTATSLTGALVVLQESTEHLIRTEDELELDGGTPQIIWRYRGEESYRAVAISKTQREDLLLKLDQTEGTPVAPQGEEPQAMVWIALGDGRVVSPCLEKSSGNVSYGTLFEYDPETEPSSSFTNALCDLIS